MIKHLGGPKATGRIRHLVTELAGCLPMLHGRLRTVLQLRAGVGQRRALGARAIARRLHISTHRVATLEVIALRRLRNAAEITSCARRPASAGIAAAATVRNVSDMPVAAGEVKSALYFRPGTQPPARSGTRRGGSSPAAVTQLASGTSLPVLIVLGILAVAVLGLVSADSLGVPVLPSRLTRIRRQRRNARTRRGRNPRR